MTCELMKRLMEIEGVEELSYESIEQIKRIICGTHNGVCSEDFFCEGHRISNQDWIRLLKELGYPVTKKCLSDEDMEYGNYNVKGINK